MLSVIAAQNRNSPAQVVQKCARRLIDGIIIIIIIIYIIVVIIYTSESHFKLVTLHSVCEFDVAGVAHVAVLC